MNIRHQPVLVREVLEGLEVKADGIYFDGTVGAGGHAEAILEKLGEGGRLIGVDCDEEILEQARARLVRFGRKVVLDYGHYEEVDSLLGRYGVRWVDGILLDLGVSTYQLETARRGFSFLREGPLDMRMDLRATETAADLVNKLGERELAEIFFDYGEEPRARLFARRVIQGRRGARLQSTQDVVSLVGTARGPRHSLHPATRLFQALRIAVNGELKRLDEFLKKFSEVLRPGGRVAILSYHSLEDRRVKEAFRAGSQQGTLRVLTKKPIRPSEGEVRENPRARSARLRIAERLGIQEVRP